MWFSCVVVLVVGSALIYLRVDEAEDVYRAARKESIIIAAILTNVAIYTYLSPGFQ